MDNLTHFANNWKIRTGINNVMTRRIIEAYRYMDQNHIDEFFSTGKLKLSTFKSNRDAEGIRNDKNEGITHFLVISKDQTKTLKIPTREGNGRLTLCTSFELNLDKYLNYFKTNGCFKINQIQGFAFEISKVLNMYRGGMEGMIEYSERKELVINLAHFPELPDLNLRNEIWKGDNYKIIEYISKAELDLYFHKRTKFLAEDEYRLLWWTRRDHRLFITCPGAVKYCEKIT
ncbi:MAG: hypothetical protein AB8B72_03045 [Crocinitomicaceae bacterium]